MYLCIIVSFTYPPRSNQTRFLCFLRLPSPVVHSQVALTTMASSLLQYRVFDTRFRELSIVLQHFVCVCSDPRTDFDDNAVCSMDDGHDISTRLLQSSLCKRDIQDRHINYYDISILQLLTFGFHKNCYFYNFFAGGVQVIFSLVNSRRYTLLVCKRNTRIRRHCFYRSTVFN